MGMKFMSEIEELHENLKGFGWELSME